MHESIVIKGARLHNLKDVTLAIPKNRLVVFTGVSGSRACRALLLALVAAIR
jgi:excinuclease ABC subunit A